jgi:hypothetical protein
MRTEFPYCYNCHNSIPYNNPAHFNCPCGFESFISYLAPPKFPCPICNKLTSKFSNYLTPKLYNNKVFCVSEYDHFCNNSTIQFYLLNNSLFKIIKPVTLSNNKTVFLSSHIFHNYSEVLFDVDKPPIIIPKLLLPNYPNIIDKLKLYLLLS